MADELAEQVTGVGALVEPARRALYVYVAAQPDAVSREQAAKAVGVPLHSAKFHLDRLVQEDLLEVEFRRLSGRTGPGAGRPSKLYRRSSRQISVSLPERRYDVAGDVLAAAIDRSIRDGVPVAEAVREAAVAEGRSIAGAFAEGARSHAGPAVSEGTAGSGDSPLQRTAEVLARHGYEPRTSAPEICLANCPFDRLANKHTELVCSMNLALIDGVIDGLDVPTLSAHLAPQPGFCCVKVTERSTSAKAEPRA
ncbi:MAG TPA: transcriptional regulator [Nocardioidaceae bacterium]|nr:transcriptional regulator [Nocardioidaceae bacterium]